MELGCEYLDGFGHTMSRPSPNARGTGRFLNGAGLLPAQDGFVMEDELPPRSLTPPGAYVSDPDEERRKVAKRVQPLHDVGASGGNPMRIKPHKQVSAPSRPTDTRFFEEPGSDANSQLISFPSAVGTISGKDPSCHQSPVTPQNSVAVSGKGPSSYQSPCSDAPAKTETSVPPPLQIPPCGKSTPLHNPSNKRTLEQLLSKANYQTVNARDPAGQTPLHCFAKRGHLEYTITLLCQGKLVDVDAQDSEGNTPMHVAVKNNRTLILNVLLAFGASVTVPNLHGKMPYDMASSDIKSFMMQFVPEIDAESFGNVGKFHNLDELVDPHALMNAKLDSLVHPQKIAAFVGCLDELVNSANDMMKSLDSFDEVVAIDKQRREVRRWKETNPLQAKPGIRVLFLDGGGIRGLNQIMILMEMERVTGRKITELFDWIIGTSIGGILALSLVYGKSKSLQEIRTLIMKIKSRVFGGILSVESSTKNLEQVLKEEFDLDTRLCDKNMTKVMVCVVSKKSASPTVEFFNNFMEDAPELTNVPVWYACRATSAAPMYFQSCGDYVDGGVMANNPSMAAWAEIQHYYAKRQEAPPHISMAVSVGTGIYPDKNMGDIDIFGKNFFSLRKMVKHVRHLIEMLRNALSQSEETARRFSAVCNDRGIPYFRFNPDLFEVIATAETNEEKIVNMMLQTRVYLQEINTLEEMSRMVTLFKHLSTLHCARMKPLH